LIIAGVHDFGLSLRHVVGCQIKHGSSALLILY
jgi:hypothetical protein